MSFRFKVKLGWFTPTADFYIFGVILAKRYGFIRNIRDFQQNGFLFGFQIRLFLVQILNLGFNFCHFSKNRGSVFSFLFQNRNLLGSFILLLF